jgi:hypothetical protein
MTSASKPVSYSDVLAIRWRDDAAQAGDSAAMLIAQRALGLSLDEIATGGYTHGLSRTEIRLALCAARPGLVLAGGLRILTIAQARAAVVSMEAAV